MNDQNYDKNSWSFFQLQTEFTDKSDEIAIRRVLYPQVLVPFVLLVTCQSQVQYSVLAKGNSFMHTLDHAPMPQGPKALSKIMWRITTFNR